MRTRKTDRDTWRGADLSENVDWGERAQKGFLGSGIDPADRKGHKNFYIDLLHKIALEEVLDLRGDEVVLDFGCGSGRIAYWIAPKVKRVVGLEVTPEMIDLAERHRTAENVEFMVYEGAGFPQIPYPIDIVLSLGVLQHTEREKLKKIVSEMARCLKKDGKLYLIEQASDNPKVDRPRVDEYLQAFEESKLECLRYYPIRSGRWLVLYLIRYGFVPKNWLPRIAHHELSKRRGETERIRAYKDFLFLLKKE